jgi:hypothetical protein
MWSTPADLTRSIEEDQLRSRARVVLCAGFAVADDAAMRVVHHGEQSSDRHGGDDIDGLVARPVERAPPYELPIVIQEREEPVARPAARAPRAFGCAR